LLDCGEGVAGATRRFLGDDEGVRVLDELKFVFITHHHPDHMAGLLGVLAARSKRAPTLPVLGPSATARWLRRAVEVGAVGEGPKGTWTQSARDVDDGVARLAAFTRTASLYARENGGGGPFWIPPKNNGGVQNVQNVLSPEGTPMTASVPPRFPPPPRSIGIPIPIPIPRRRRMLEKHHARVLDAAETRSEAAAQAGELGAFVGHEFRKLRAGRAPVGHRQRPLVALLRFRFVPAPRESLALVALRA
jgi:hypothetical protein